MTQQNKPILRFKNFSEDWEQRKLSQLGETQSGIGFPEKEQGGTVGIPFYKVSDMNNPGNENELITSNNYINEKQLQRKRWKPITTVPAVVFAKVGAAIMLNRKRIVHHPFLIDNNTMAYIFDNSWDVDFGKTLFETINLPRFAQVGALPSYNGSDIENIKVRIPSKNEQQQIGSIFKQLDNAIALHQRKLELLKEQKTGFLQKMFPKNGSNVPEIRFSGFTEDWEQRKLGELIENQTILLQSDGNHGELYPKSNEFSETGIPYLSASNIDLNTSSIDFSSSKYLPINKAKIFKKGIAKDGDILLAHNATVGPTVMLSTHYPFVVLSTTLTLFRINQSKMNPKFFLYMLRSAQFQHALKKMMKQTTRNQVPILTQRNIDVSYPNNIDEQTKLGIFFKQLDETIALHQKQLEVLKETKKSLLQKMFV